LIRPLTSGTKLEEEKKTKQKDIYKKKREKKHGRERKKI
jgi:hypothetical protein